MDAKRRVLVVDDELGMREVLEILLAADGYEVQSVASPDEAKSCMETGTFDVVLTDLRMGSGRHAGMDLLTWLNENAPWTPAIMMTAYGSVETAIEAMKLGAADYITKPFKNDEVRLLVKRAIDERNLRRENAAHRQDQARRARIDNLIGATPVMDELRDMIRRVATLPSTVHIHGESGTGKELVSMGIHQLSQRANKPFVAVNCGGIPENLLESELFGHMKGSFTGAYEDKEGLFVVANGGTLFLDEIGEMPLALQVKMLRVLDNSVVTPVGGTAGIPVDVRIISATNRDLSEMVHERRFREDLFYRLNVIPICVPPLRSRADDIPLLARHFEQEHATQMGRAPLEISPEAEAALRAFTWPGNVRELRNVMERAGALCRDDRIDLSDLPQNVRDYVPGAHQPAPTLTEGGLDLEEHIAGIERELIEQALRASKYSQKRAAKLLRLTPRSLRYRLQKYGLDSQ